MAGAMRRMGIYLGLVEDDDTRGYGRYDARQSDHPEPTAATARYADDHYDDHVRGRLPDGLRRRGRRRRGRAGARARAAVASAASRRPVRSAWRPVASARGSRRFARAAPWAAARWRRAAGLAVREPVVAVARSRRRPRAPQPYRITTLHPRTYNEARTIGERFRDGMPVIMNLTEMDDADAKRLVDFAAGLSFGLRGSIERVTAKVFLLSPQNVDVTAEDKARIREGGFFNQS